MESVDSPQVEVRRLGPADLNLVVSCAALLPESPTVEWAEDFFARGTSYFFAALIGRTPVGVLAATELPSFGASPDLDIYLLSVDPQHRHLGVGTSLVSRAVETAEESGFAHVRIAVSSQIDPAAVATDATAHRWEMQDWQSLVITLE